MGTQKPDTSARNGHGSAVETNVSSRAKRAGSALARYGRNGSIAVLAGCALLVRAARSSTGTGTRAGQALLGGALFAVGFRQQQAEGGPTAGEILARDDGERSERTGDSKTVADDAHTARERNDVTSQPETNPRGVSGEPDVEAVTEADDGDVRFTATGDELRPKPSLGDEASTDPRNTDAGDDGVEIDLSESALADEASEATGPTPEQAEPAQVEDTEPDRSPSEDTSHMEADVPDGSDSDAASGAADDERPGDGSTGTGDLT